VNSLSPGRTRKVSEQVSQVEEGHAELPARKPGDASRRAIAALLVKIDAVLGETEPALLTKADA
jgi:hypothetical protein